jgi:hypothetical protein
MLVLWSTRAVLGIYSLNKKKAFISSDLKLTLLSKCKGKQAQQKVWKLNLQSREEEVKCILLR